MTPAGLRPSILPPKLWILSNMNSIARPVSRGASGTEAAISVARSSVTRRRSHLNAAGAGGGGAGGGLADGAGEEGPLGRSVRPPGAVRSPDRSPYFSVWAARG